MASSITGILRELETNIVVHQSKPSHQFKPSIPSEDPQVQELRQELQAAKHENSSLRTSLSSSNESLGRLSSEVWRFDTERQQLQLLRQASAELCDVVRTLGLTGMHSGTSGAETAEQSVREMQAATRALREAAAGGKLLPREELAAERERLARAAQAVQATQLRAARARELRRRQETCDAACATERAERHEQSSQCDPCHPPPPPPPSRPTEARPTQTALSGRRQANPNPNPNRNPNPNPNPNHNPKQEAPESGVYVKDLTSYVVKTVG